MGWRPYHSEEDRRKAWRQERLRRFARRVPLILLACLIGLGAGALAVHPWSLTDAVLHLVAAPTCDAARAVGLTPAFRGEPGYWAWHDRDGNGVACAGRAAS